MKYLILLLFSINITAQDTLIVKLTPVKSKRTIITETETIGDLEVTKKEIYNKEKALKRIETLNNEIVNDSIRSQMILESIDQMKSEAKKSQKRKRINENIRIRLLNILDQL